MRIELVYEDGEITLYAHHPVFGNVSSGRGQKLGEAVKDLISRFAEMQASTIEALNESGIVRYVSTKDLELS